jgi:outer membrane protein insertion porin family
VFVDAGAVFGVVTPLLQTPQNRDENGNLLFLTTDAAGEIITTTSATNAAGVANTPSLAFTEQFFGDSPKPRVSVGFGVNWNSPFGPFRIDIARALLREPGDDTRLFTFNVGTQF